VSVEPSVRSQAIRDLIRPWEVADLWETTNQPVLWHQSTAEKVAAWLKQQFERHELFYARDPPGIDMWCPPSATRLRRCGDCEDHSILAASLIEAGSRIVPSVAVGTYCKEDVCLGHAWVEGIDEHGWFLLEATTGDLFRSGRPARYRLDQLLSRTGRFVM